MGGPLPPQYRDGGYPFRDVGTHALYLMEAFLGEIQNVHTRFATQGGDPNLLYDEWRALVACAHGSGHVQLSWNVRPQQHFLIVQGTKGVLRADLSSMTMTVKKSTPLPKAMERPLFGMREGMQVATQVPANAIRFVRKKILQYHGLQMLVADFYRTLESGEPTPVPVERARPIVEWIERAAREADASKSAFLQKFPKSLTAPILVTGAAGFIGRHLVRRLLSEGARLRVFVRREPSSEWMNNQNVEVVIGDLGDPEAVDRAVAGTETIYHIGGAMKGGAHDFERGTVVGTRNVLASMKRHRVGKLIYVSSLSVIWASNARKGEKLTENAPLETMPEKRGVYSQTKLEAERIVTEAVKNDGLRAVILRPAKVIGPGVQPLGFEIAFRAKGRMVIVGNGSMAPPMVYVEDLVDAIKLAAASDALDGSIFHIVDSEEVTRNELAREYLNHLMPGGKMMRVPITMFYGLALLVQILFKFLGRPAPLSTYKLRSAFAPLSFDSTAAEKRLGWKPKVGVRAGLRETLKSLPH
jgi:nucleoside-diphosphate-sugar epimerase